MAEAFDSAIRRRLDIINGMGEGANWYSRQLAQNVRQPGFGAGANGPGMRQPGFQSGMPVRNGQYNGPRGNQAALIAFGKMLQQRGFRVSENSFFNGGRRVTGGHSPNSRHYSDRAIDVNFAPGTSKREQKAIDQIVGLAAQYGLRSIWRKPNHFNHAHFDY